MRFVVLFLYLFSTFCFSEINFPELTGRIVDNANVLSESTKIVLDKQLCAHEKEASNQVVIVTIDALPNISIEEFGFKLGNHWGVGQKGKDNGVLLILAKRDRKVRIEVGKGLESVLTKSKAQRIINDEFVPSLKIADFDGAFLGATSAVIKGLSQEKGEMGFISIVTFIFFVILILLSRSFFNKIKKEMRNKYDALKIISRDKPVRHYQLIINIIYLLFCLILISILFLPFIISLIANGDDSNNGGFTGGGGSFGGGGASGGY